MEPALVDFLQYVKYSVIEHERYMCLFRQLYLFLFFKHQHIRFKGALEVFIELVMEETSRVS